MNVIARREFELAYNDSAAQHFNNYATRTNHGDTRRVIVSQTAKELKEHDR